MPVGQASPDTQTNVRHILTYVARGEASQKTEGTKKVMASRSVALP
jgi:hypothetical protein